MVPWSALTEEWQSGQIYVRSQRGQIDECTLAIFSPADQQTRQFQVLELTPWVPISTPEERMSTLVQPWRSSISQSRARPWGQNQPDANSTSGPTHILASDNPWPLIFLFDKSYFSSLFWSTVEANWKRRGEHTLVTRLLAGRLYLKRWQGLGLLRPLLTNKLSLDNL